MSVTEILIYGLAVWRLSSLLVSEAGPFHIFQWVRERVGIRHFDDGTVAAIPGNIFAQILSCVWCASLWISFVFIQNGIAVVLAISAIAILVEKAVRKQ